MYILMLSRGIPSKNDPQWGCFEKDQAEALASIGHKVVVVSIDGRFKKNRGKLGLHHYENINGVEYYNYIMVPANLLMKFFGEDKVRKKIKLKILDKIYKRIEKKYGKPDVIYSHFFYNTVTGLELKKKYNIPLVTIEHLARFNHEKLDHSTEKFSKYAFEGADKLVTVSNSLGEAIKKRFNTDYSVVHNLYGQEFGIRPKADHHSSKFKFITTGSLIKRKGFDVLIDALAEIKIPRKNWILHIIGSGEEKENLKNQIYKNGLQDNIKLLGKMDKTHIAQELSESNVFVLPSRNENFSVAILEALSMGLPVVATDCGGIRECLNTQNGIIVPVEDKISLANALVEIYENYTKFDREYIYNDCIERFSPQSIAHKLTNIFEETIKEYENK